MKNRFPIFNRHPELVYLDSASTTQRVDSALRAMEDYHLDFNANVHRGLYPMGEQATSAYEHVREITQRFLNAPSPRNIVFTRGTTEGLNMVAQSWASKFLKPGDEIVLTMMEHHSNWVPWQRVAEKTGAVLKFCPLTADGDLDYEALEALLGPRTKLITLTGLSNVLGTLVDLPRVQALAQKSGAKICGDAAQLAAHQAIDVQALDLDFLAFSSHKIYGPTGAGVLYAKPELLESMDPWMTGGDMIREVHLECSTWNDFPWKMEAGTLPIASIIGMGAAMEFLMELGFAHVEEHDRTLHDFAVSELSALPGLRLFGPMDAARHRGALSFTLDGIHPHDIASLLGERGICVRAGHHCTMPLHKMLGVPATVRLSFGVYSIREDLEKLKVSLEEIQKLFG